MRKKIGIIGLNGQAKRIIEILDRTTGVELAKIYYHKISNNKELNRITKNFNDLLNLDAIIIASPTHTHYDYWDHQLLRNRPVGSPSIQDNRDPRRFCNFCACSHTIYKFKDSKSI